MCDEVKEELRLRLDLLNVKHFGLECVRTQVEFDPDKESDGILRDWLVYRGCRITGDDLRALAKQEIIRGYGKPFRFFSVFNPGDASLDFLRAWLSCFGIAAPKESQSSNDYVWYLTRANQMKTLLYQLASQSTLEEKFALVGPMRAQVREKKKELGLLLNRLQMKTNPKPITNNPTISISTKEQKEWKGKQALALAMKASAIAVPIALHLVQPDEKKLAGFSLKDKVKAEIPSLLGRGFLMGALPTKLGDAALRDINQGNRSLIPQEASSQLFAEFLTENPNLIRFVTGLLVPSASSLSRILLK